MCCVFSSIAAPRRDATHAHARARPERPLHTEARELEKRGGPSTALRRRGRQAEKVLVRSAGRLNKNAAFVTSLAGGRFWFRRRPEATSQGALSPDASLPAASLCDCALHAHHRQPPSVGRILGGQHAFLHPTVAELADTSPSSVGRSSTAACMTQHNGTTLHCLTFVVYPLTF